MVDSQHSLASAQQDSLPTRDAAPNRWLLIAAALCLAATVVPVGLPASKRWMITLENATHTGIFAVVTLAALNYLQAAAFARNWSHARRHWTVLGIAATAGTLTELLQIPGPRSASFSDFVLDISGSLMALACVALCRHLRAHSTPRWLLPGHAALGAIALAVFAAPLAKAALAYHDRSERFPELVRFDRPWSTYFISGRSQRERRMVPQQWRERADETGLHVKLPLERWPRVNLTEVYPDWSRYRFLVLDVVNPMPEAMELTVRVEDAAHNQAYDDRFNMVIVVPAEERKRFMLSVAQIAHAPAKRAMNLGKMTRVTLYRDEPAEPSEMYLMGIWLQ